MLHFASRRAMRIEGLGGSLVDQLVQKGMLRDFGDLYTLTLDQVAGLERMAKKSASNFTTFSECESTPGPSGLSRMAVSEPEILLTTSPSMIPTRR